MLAFNLCEAGNTHEFWLVEDRGVVEILLGYC
jgi:hypothetical protein